MNLNLKTIRMNFFFKEILAKFNELPVEKPGLKRLESRSSAGVQHTTNPVENDWITDEFLAELARQKVRISLPSSLPPKTIVFLSVGIESFHVTPWSRNGIRLTISKSRSFYSRQNSYS